MESPTDSPPFSAMAVQMALKERMDPTERSMAPEEMMHIIPQARSSR